MTVFEKEVRKALIDKEIKMGQFHKMLGISAQYLYDAFNGNRPAVDLKQRIAKILELNLKEIEEREV